MSDLQSISLSFTTEYIRIDNEDNLLRQFPKVILSKIEHSTILGGYLIAILNS